MSPLENAGSRDGFAAQTSDHLELVSLFSGFASPRRLRILQELHRGPRSATQLARICHVSVQESMRHLGRLSDLDLVRKQPDRCYEMTPLGRLTQVPVAMCSDLLRDREFFLTHDLGFVPPALDRTALVTAPRSHKSAAEHLREAAQAIGTYRGFLHQASGESLLAVEPLPLDGEPAGLPREWGGVFTPQVALGEEFQRIPEDLAALAESPEGLRVRVGLLPSVPFMLGVNEREAVLFAPDHQGRVDLASMIRCAAEPGRTWADQLYAHYARSAVTAFDTAQGDRFPDWRVRILDTAKRVQSQAPRAPGASF